MPLGILLRGPVHARLVLNRHRVDRDARSCVSLDEPDEYCAYAAYHFGSSWPPIIVPLLFIQPGGLHGDAKNSRSGFLRRAS